MRAFHLESPRLGFGLWGPEDLGLAQALWGDPAVARFIHAAGRFSPEEAETRLAREREIQGTRGVQYWPLFVKADGAFAGCCGLRPYGHEEDVLELGIHLLPAHWHKGYAREACARVIAHAFEDLGVRALFAGHHPANEASRALLARLGFRGIGEAFYAPTGLQHPTYILERKA